MDNEDFLKECLSIGVESITETEHHNHEDGFKVNLKNGEAIYILFKDEYGDHWTEYKRAEKYHAEWANIHIMTDEERRQFDIDMIERMKQRYAPENFDKFFKLLNPQS